MTHSAELAFLFRTLKAPAAARALPKLAERARAEEWSYERFCECPRQRERERGQEFDVADGESGSEPEPRMVEPERA